jgi:hypothetical protein
MADDFSPDPFENLPEDPELAFLQLEAAFRAECDRQLGLAGERERTDVIYVDYIAQVLAAIEELGLQANFHTAVPSIEDVNYNTYLNFNKDVKHFRTALEIRHRRRAQGYSVEFDGVAKAKIHHHLEQIREIFEKLELDERKREELFAKLNELQQEVDMNRSHLDRLGAFMAAASGIVGDSIHKSRILELMAAISAIFWGARPTQRLIQAPPKPKHIEAPRKPKPEMDDEIPF